MNLKNFFDAPPKYQTDILDKKMTAVRNIALAADILALIAAGIYVADIRYLWTNGFIWPAALYFISAAASVILMYPNLYNYHTWSALVTFTDGFLLAAFALTGNKISIIPHILCMIFPAVSVVCSFRLGLYGHARPAGKLARISGLLPTKIAVAVCFIASCAAFFVYSGSTGPCGEDARWKRDSTTLRIMGQGSVRGSFMYDSAIPFDDIERVTIGEGITEIDSDIFSLRGNAVSSLSEIYLPSTLTNINDKGKLFGELPELSYIEVTNSSKSYSSSDGVLFNSSGSELLKCPPKTTGEYAVPEEVKSIADYAFSGCDLLTDVELPEGLTDIGEYAFENCDAIKLADWPESLETAGKSAYFSCDSLESAVMHKGIKQLGFDVFEQCDKLESVTYDGSEDDLSNITGIDHNGAITRLVKYVSSTAMRDKLNEIFENRKKLDLSGIPNYSNLGPAKSSAEPSTAPEPAKSEKKTLIAEPLSASQTGIKPDKSSNKIQSFESYAENRLKYGSPRSFSGEADDFEVVKAYVNLICSGDMNFELADTFEFSYNNVTSCSYAINYTGTADVPREMDMTYKKGVKCDVCIYVSIDKNDLSLGIALPDEIENEDLGFRYSGKTVSVDPAGKSALAGLYKTGDVFETDDGRLKTQLGKAAIFRDGESITSDAEYTITADTEEELEVNNFYRTESLYFTVPVNALRSGDVFKLEDLKCDREGYGDPRIYRLGTAFAACHGGEWIYPLFNNSQYKDLTVRVMYYERNVEAVFYIYASFKSSPNEIEALCAVDLSGGEVDPSVTDEFSMTVNSSLDITCPTEYMPNWELFSWTIMEGSTVVDISGESNKTCTVKAKRPGTARIKVNYEYGAEEADVLTGITRRVGKSNEYQYVITVK